MNLMKEHPDATPAPALTDLVEVMLDNTQLSAKPPRGDAAWPKISLACASNRRKITVAALARRVSQGCSFAPGVFRDGKRSEETWTRQQVFALDFDNEKEENSLTPELFLRRCEALDIIPAFVYPSFSDSPDRRKFRAVFVSDAMVTNPRLRIFIQALLMEIFSFDDGNPDSACKDAARFFLGTNKALIHADFTAKINPVQLFDTHVKLMERSDPAHFSRNLERFCHRVGLFHAGTREFGVIFVKYLCEMVSTSFENHDFGPEGMVNLGEIDVRPIYYDTHTSKSPIFDIPLGEKGLEACYSTWNGMLFKLIFQNPSISRTLKPKNTPESPRACEKGFSTLQKRRVTEADRQVLTEKCRLLNEFIQGSRKLGHRERRLLITNLLTLSGGEEWFKQGLSNRSDYTRDSLVEDAKRYRMKPEGCAHCPYSDECEHKTNLLQQIPLRKRECRRICEPPQREALDVTREKLSSAIQMCMESDENRIFVIKCDTGVGKTEILLDQDLEGVCVAFDTHRLKEEAYNRLLDKGQSAYLWPEAPKLPDRLHKVAERRHAIGAGGVTGLYRKALEMPEVFLDPVWEGAIQEYLDALKTVHSQSCILATHEKAYQLQHNRDIHTVVFDEDVTKTLVRVVELGIEDVRCFLEVLEEQDGAKFTRMADYLRGILKTPPKITVKPTPVSYSRRLLRQLLAKMPSSFNSPVEALFQCVACRIDSAGRGGAERIYCVTRQHLHEDRKHIVLSATADEAIYRRLFGDRLEFVDLSGTELKGRLACHTSRSFSKTSVMEDPAKFAAKAQKDMAELGFSGIITHKFMAGGETGGMTLKHTEGTVPVYGTFGGLQGLDSFGGTDIAVYGTPYPPEYAARLWATLLGIDLGEEDASFSEQSVEMDEFEVSVPVFTDNLDVQRLYLWLARSEIVQAVGRARLVSNDCTVHVFSRLPISGCELNP